MAKKLVVFLHGWSVRSTDTYGRLPERLQAEAAARGVDIDVQHVYLGKYVSFRDEVRLEDISLAFEAALEREAPLQKALKAGGKIAVVTHSTGGPVARDWWHRFYVSRKRECPMSHLIMLAPANFGSALAQLGKGTLSRLKTWFQGVEPGQGVLDWLELGSSESWRLNESWITQKPSWYGDTRVFPFVLTGQSIDRALYDHLNSYTDEVGTDGVVRVAAANLNATYVQLVQEFDEAEFAKGNWGATRLVVKQRKQAPRTALAVLPGLSHSGDEMGILRSVKLRDSGKLRPHPTVEALLECLGVGDEAAYDALCDRFDALTAKTQADERVEKVDGLFGFTREFKRPVATQMIVRVHDENGYQLDDFDFVLTSWIPDSPRAELREPNPNLLPAGFFIDRQRNRRARGTLTYYLNHEIMSSAPALGVRIAPRPAPDPAAKKPVDHFVHYVNAELAARTHTLLDFLRPNSTLLLDVVLQRVVRAGVLRLTTEVKPKDFTRDDPGEALA
ncbi:MAG: phospholipase [Planctomycetes bacterium]|nr:phospholipase [Planctomycetota bacterium]